MEKISQLEKDPKQELKELAGSWQKKYTESLKVVLKEGKTADDIVGVIWEKGILDHVVPKDEKVLKARKELGRFVLDIDRESPELYWRILYGAATILEAEKKNYSVIPDCIASQAIQQALVSLDQADYRKFFPDWNPGKSGENPYYVFMNKIMEKAKQELEKRGQKPYLIPWGSKGEFNGIPVIIESYLDGLVVLRVRESENTMENHMKLGKITEFTNSVSPSELNPEDFKLPEKNK